MELTNEIWKPIINEAHYEVSNLGRVKHVAYTLECNGRGDKIRTRNYKEKIRKPQVVSTNKSTKGYLQIKINNHYYYVHRLVAIAFIPNTQNKPEVNHIDEDTYNNKLDNLEWSTRLENLNHGSRNARVSLAIKDNENGVKYRFDNGTALSKWSRDNNYSFGFAKKYLSGEYTLELLELTKKYNIKSYNIFFKVITENGLDDKLIELIQSGITSVGELRKYLKQNKKPSILPKVKRLISQGLSLEEANYCIDNKIKSPLKYLHIFNLFSDTIKIEIKEANITSVADLVKFISKK